MLGFSIGVVFGSVVVLGAAYRGMRALSRARATALGPEEPALRRARGVTARVSMDEGRPGAPPRASGTLTHADAVLTARRLVVATHAGRLIDAGGPGLRVRCTGPQRLVIEAERPHAAGTRRVRVELLVPDAERWAQEAQERLGLERVGLPAPGAAAPDQGR